MIKKYTKGNIRVIWNDELCEHAGKCVKGLPAVFDPKSRPWINLNPASVNEIIKTVSTCPSGALSIENLEGEGEPEATTVEVRAHGPLRIKGSFIFVDKDGTREHKTIASFCRCGQSNNKPFCDGTHKAIKFDDQA